MSSVLKLPLPQRCASRAQTFRRRAEAFPWLLSILCWGLLFLIWNQLDSPITWEAAQDPSSLAQGAKEGSLLGRVVIVTLGAIGAWLLAGNWRKIRLNRPFAALLFAYFGWTMLSGLWADDPALATRRLASLALMFLFAAGCAIRYGPRQLTWFMAAIPTLSLIPGFLAEVGYGTFHPFDGESRFVGTAPHPNVEAAGLAVGSVLLFWLSWRARGLVRIGFGLAGLIVTFFLYATGSRTALLAVILAVLFSCALITLRDYKSRIPMLVALITLGFVSLQLFNLFLETTSGKPVGVSSFASSRDDGDVTSFNGRLSLWRTLLIFAWERPVRGYGYGSFWSPKHIDFVSAEQGWAIQQSHSSYVEQVLALGFTGAGLYIALLLASLAICAYRFLRGDDSHGSWAAVMFFIAIHNATEAINVSPLFTNFAFNLIVLHIALAPAQIAGLSKIRQAAPNQSLRYRGSSPAPHVRSLG